MCPFVKGCVEEGDFLGEVLLILEQYENSLLIVRRS